MYGHEVAAGQTNQRTIKIGEETLRVDLKDYTHKRIRQENLTDHHVGGARAGGAGGGSPHKRAA